MLEEEKDLFILELDGSIIITPWARKFYEEQGLDPEIMAKQWEERLLNAPKINE